MKINIEEFERSLKVINKNPSLFSEKFYENVFSLSPSLKNTFRNTDLSKQKLEFITGLNLIFTLRKSPDELSLFLENLGIRHVCYEVESDDYQIIEDALLITLKDTLEDLWDEKTQNSWKKLASHISAMMKKGAIKVNSWSNNEH